MSAVLHLDNLFTDQTSREEMAVSSTIQINKISPTPFACGIILKKFQIQIPLRQLKETPWGFINILQKSWPSHEFSFVFFFFFFFFYQWMHLLLILLWKFQPFLVYQLRAQNLTFVEPMPEQVGTLSMHFPEVSQGTYKKFSSPKLGEPGQIDVFPCRILSQWGKSNPKLRFFNIPCSKKREKLTLNFWTENFEHSSPGTLRKCIVVEAICSRMGATNFVSRAPTDFSR